ncbi:TIGR02466 family protein [Anabaena sp. PCC 7108]|uniref:TIGR02466 family protein n=1 Tax=Anabaena sp. PCC 7108 TaxID=163908 RepID=UPI00037BF8A2|nr:TIGR02466 family protein [Anabaena sp. PCC 7108]
MTSNQKDCFPTPIWLFSIDEYPHLNKKLMKLIQMEYANDKKGMKMSNVLGWHSLDNLNKRDDFQDLMKIIKTNVLEVTNLLKWDLNQLDINIKTAWAIVNGKFAYNSVHEHPNSLLSGVYYIKSPQDCGGLLFHDPRISAHRLLPPYLEFTPWTMPSVAYKPVEGNMIIFPSWLMHSVEPNLSNEERVSISFNIGVKQKV